MVKQDLIGNWNYPTTIHFGLGRVAELDAICKKLAIQKVLLVTDNNLFDLSLINEPIEALKNLNIAISFFIENINSVREEDVKKGIETFRQANAELIIAIGGGSVLDMAKAIALGSVIIGDICSLNLNALEITAQESLCPLIAIPTTTSADSAVNASFLMYNTSANRYQYVTHPALLPKFVIADAALSAGLSAHLTAATGLHALSNHLDSYCNETFQPFSTGLNLEGIRFIKENLSIAYQDPNNLQSRGYLLVAGLMGGIDCYHASGAMHALSQALSTQYGLHQGLLKGILLPYVLMFNRQAIEAKMSHLAHYLGLISPLFSAVFEWLITFRHELNIPHTLKPLGISIDCVDSVSAMASQYLEIENNPIPLDADSIKKIYLNAILGEL